MPRKADWAQFFARHKGQRQLSNMSQRHTSVSPTEPPPQAEADAEGAQAAMNVEARNAKGVNPT